MILFVLVEIKIHTKNYSDAQQDLFIPSYAWEKLFSNLATFNKIALYLSKSLPATNSKLMSILSFAPNNFPEIYLPL
jgi:hypothetical protein